VKSEGERMNGDELDTQCIMIVQARQLCTWARSVNNVVAGHRFEI
jgi:hypothetical protein